MRISDAFEKPACSQPTHSARGHTKTRQRLMVPSAFPLKSAATHKEDNDKTEKDAFHVCGCAPTPSDGATCAVVYDEIADCISLYGSCVELRVEGCHGSELRLKAEPGCRGIDQ